MVNIGDSGCGKTSLTIRLCEGRFQPGHNVTIGVEFGSRIIPLPCSPADPSSSSSLGGAVTPSKEGHIPKIKLQIWDTAGQETFRSITRSYFRGCAGAIIVYDVTRRSTFLSAGKWLEELKQAEDEGYAGDSGGATGEGGRVSVILVGNKKDLVASDLSPDDDQPEQQEDSRRKGREVTYEEACAWAGQNGVDYFVETSAKSGEGVEEAFVMVAREIYERIRAGSVVVGGKGSGVKAPQTHNRVLVVGGKGRAMIGCC